MWKTKIGNNFMDIFNDRNIAKLQFYQTLLNSIENKEYVTTNRKHVDKTEKTWVEKDDLHTEVLNEEEAHTNVLNEETGKSPLAENDAPTESHKPCEKPADLVRDDKRIKAWLTALLNVYPASKEESLPPVATFNTNWDIDSGDEEGTTQHLADGTNPFRSASLDEDAVEEVVVSGDYDREGYSAEYQMENFMQRIQCRAAVPQYALVSTRDSPCSLLLYYHSPLVSPIQFSG